MNFDLLIINSDINDSVIHQALKINQDQASDRLVIVLDTLGGNPFAAYRAMQHLGSIYQTIHIVVPDKAMSAGTLMCMGADEIYMHQGSSLGPLDLQISHPTDGGQISTLDIRESTYDIFGLTSRVAKQLFIQAVNEMSLGKNQAAKMAHEAAVELLKPMVDKIDPYHLHASYRGASIGQKYAFILLASRMMSKNNDQARITSRRLAEDYEMHSYSITMEEASNYLLLEVSNITELDVISQLQSVIDAPPEGVTFMPIRIPQARKKAEKGDKDDAQPTKEAE
jgi:membrane-bound ClpP family serine protease